jgi:phospholipase/lecithinase/hemolysin
MPVIRSFFRRPALGLLAILLLLPALAEAAAAPRHGTLLVFGDSYSVALRNRVRGWPWLLQSTGDVRLLGDLALSGATAENLPAARSTFKEQVDTWLRGSLKGRAADVTAVYFGYNDVKSTRPLLAAKVAFAAQVDRLVAAGVARNGRRLLLVQIHDISRNPLTRGYGRARVQDWNRHVAAVARARPRVEVVNLFELFERVFARPASFGLRNVTTVDPARAATTALFADSYHFGQRGQAIVASGMRSALTARRSAATAVAQAEAAPSFSAALVQPPRGVCCQ